MIDPTLRDLLVCPVDHGSLTDDVGASRLVCDICGLRYPVVDGIPLMLVDEADRPAS